MPRHILSKQKLRASSTKRSSSSQSATKHIQVTQKLSPAAKSFKKHIIRSNPIKNLISTNDSHPGTLNSSLNPSYNISRDAYKMVPHQRSSFLNNHYTHFGSSPNIPSQQLVVDHDQNLFLRLQCQPQRVPDKTNHGIQKHKRLRETQNMFNVAFKLAPIMTEEEDEDIVLPPIDLVLANLPNQKW